MNHDRNVIKDEMTNYSITRELNKDHQQSDRCLLPKFN
jgi:hypothetical protein